MAYIDSELYRPKIHEGGARSVPHVGGKALHLPNMPATSESCDLKTGKMVTVYFKAWRVRVIIDEDDEWEGCELGGVHLAVHLGDHLWLLASPYYQTEEEQLADV